MTSPAVTGPALRGRRQWLAALAALAYGSVSAQQPGTPARDDHDHNDAPDVLSVLGKGPCARFAALLRATGADRRIQQMPAMTLFVPIDETWSAMHRGAAPNADAASQLWLANAHIFASVWTSRGEEAAVLPNLNGDPITLQGDAVNGATFWLQALRVKNGRVHFVRGFIA